jgi:hypothetical protein
MGRRFPSHPHGLHGNFGQVLPQVAVHQLCLKLGMDNFHECEGTYLTFNRSLYAHQVVASSK